MTRMTSKRELLLLVLGLACVACATGHGRGTPQTALDVLQRRDPAVEWNANSLIQADLDQDGVPDYALEGLREDRVVVGLVHGPVAAGSPAWTLEFPWNGGGEDALCSKDARIAPEPLDDTAAARAGRPVKGTGINLHDDRCDAFHIFWNPEKKKFEWWRL
jgi:hypothetical protein